MPSNPGQNVHLVSSQIHAVASSSYLANSSSQLVVLSSYLVESSRTLHPPGISNPFCEGNIMPSNPGQNVHLVSSQIHAVASSSHLANSSSQLVVLSSYLVESSSHLVVLSILLTSPLLVYSSVILQLLVSCFNLSCHSSTRRVPKSVVWTSCLSLQIKPSGPRDENKRRPGHQRQDKRTAQARVLPVLRKMDEVNVVKDILRDALSRIDQIPSQSSQSQSGNPSQQQNLPVSTNNDSLLSRAQNNFR